MLGLHSSVKGAQRQAYMQATAFSYRLAQQHGNMRKPQLMREKGILEYGTYFNPDSFFPFPAFTPPLHDVHSM